MRQFECQAYRAHFRECGRCVWSCRGDSNLGVDQGDSGGRGGAKLMMVQPGDIRSALLQPADGRDRGGTAIDREEQSGWILFKAIFDSVLAEPIPLLHPMRQITFYLPSKCAQYFK